MGRALSMMDLRELPFIRFESKNGGGNTMIYLIVELDDCCTKCKFDYCKLLHSVSQSDKFRLIYINDSNQDKHRISKLNCPKIRLIQRLKNIFDKQAQSMTLSDLRQRHNAKYPDFESHEPTASGIDIRFKSTFCIKYNEDTQDPIISFKKGNKYKNSNNHLNNTQKNGMHSKTTHIVSSKKANQSPWKQQSQQQKQ